MIGLSVQVCVMPHELKCVCARVCTLQGSEPLIGEVIVCLQSLDASLENLLLLLHFLNP